MILLVTGGKIDEAILSEYLLGKHGVIDMIMAADKGVEGLIKLGAKPDYLVGDFDSFSGDLDALLSDSSIVVKRLNPVKDDTDTESALRWILELVEAGHNISHDAFGTCDIVIIGGTGTRIDHILGNISILGIPMEKGYTACLVDSCNRIRMINSKMPTVIKAGEFGDYVSVFPVGDSASGVDLSGFKYPLKDARLTWFNSLGVSNEIIDTEGHITVKEGALIVVESKDC